MTTIIGLWQSSNNGKTSTLNMLISMLELATINTATPHNILENRKAIFIINNLVVGVGTEGDDWNGVDGNCSFFDDNNCDIVFTATRKRSDSGSVKRLEEYAALYGLNVSWVPKNVTNNTAQESLVNFQQAIELFNMI